MTLDVGLVMHIVYRKGLFFMYYWCRVFIWLVCDFQCYNLCYTEWIFCDYRL